MPSLPDAPPAPHRRLASLNCRLEDLEQAPGLWEAELQQTWPSLGRELGSLTQAAGELEQRPGLRDGLLGPGHRLACSPAHLGPLLELLSTRSQLGLTCWSRM